MFFSPWGTGLYDSDRAADVAREVVRHGLAVVEQALRRYRGVESIVAADVVARLKTGRGDESEFGRLVGAWVDVNADVAWQPLLPAARSVVEQARLPDGNELYEFWAGSDSLEAWLAVLNDLDERLA